MRDALKFFRSFVREPGRVGAVLPSSRFLSALLVGDVESLREGDVVVEYGPGTGPMTEVLDRRLPKGVRYLGIELDPQFCSVLRARFPRLEFVEASAADIAALLAERDLPQPRRIISGIPFASLPAGVQRGIVDGTKAALAPDGEFRTFQYVHAYRLGSAKRFRAMMEGAFQRFERLGPVLRNVPPAYVLRYRK